MITWLQLLSLELEGIEERDFCEPPHQGIKGDHVIGRMSDDCKKLWTLHIQLEKVARQSLLDAHYSHDKVETERLETLACVCTEKAHTLLALMWIGIRDEFEIWNKEIGIRTGYKVVVRPETEDNDMPPFLKRLLGLNE